MRIKWILLPMFVVLVGCGTSVSDKSKDPNNTNGDPGENNATNNENNAEIPVDPADCEGVSIPDGAQCTLPERTLTVGINALAGFPETWSQAWVCLETLSDEDAARTYTYGTIIAESENCLVTDGDDDFWGYAAGIADFGDVTLAGSTGEVTLDSDDAFEGCVEFDGPEMFVQANATYEISIEGNDEVPAVARTLVTPPAPDVDCPTVEPGEPLLFEWTEGGADHVLIRVGSGDVQLRCEVPDNGRLEIPAELTSEFPADAAFFTAEVNKVRVDWSHDEPSNTWVRTYVGSRHDCTNF